MRKPASTPTPVPKQERRPLSPHLQIYRPQITSVLSIVHRLTGVALFGGACVWALFLVGLSSEWMLSTGASQRCTGFSCSLLSICLSGKKIRLLGLCLFLPSLFYHLLNGVRHLAWDVGLGFGLPQVHRSGKAVLLGTGVLTGVTLWHLL